jgi:hypothetical protein
VRRCSAAALACLAIVATSAACTSGPGGSAPALADIARLLSRHGQAVLQHDRSAFLADLDEEGRAAVFRSAQAAEFANLVKIPLTRWSYRLDSRTEDRSAEDAATKRFGSKAVIVRVDLTYALRGADPVPTSHFLWWTFVRRGGRVVVAGDDGLAAAGGVSWRGPWDFGPLTVVRGAAGVVLGHTDRSSLEVVAAAVDGAVPAVTDVWGRGWTRYVAVIVPGSAEELAAITGEGSSVTTQVAAAAISDATDPVTGTVLGQRLVVNPEALSRLTAVGRQIVIRHETTHIAAARFTTDATPRWLAEGFADYIGNLGSGQSPKVAAAELRADVIAGRLPERLPQPADFDTGAAAPQAYEESWLACRLIAQRVGVAGLVRFYRMVGASPSDAETAARGAFAALLHETPAQFTVQWRHYVQQQLG